MLGDFQLSSNDRALLGEAVRRVETARRREISDRQAIEAAVSTAFASGRRDMFGLVKAGHRAR